MTGIQEPEAGRPDDEDPDDELEEAAEGRRRPRPAALGVTVLGLALAVYLLVDLRQSIAFWFSTAPAVDLGAPGEYRPERASDNLHARIAVVPGGSASRFSRYGKQYEIVAVQGTAVLVRRDVERAASAPGRAPFEAAGRLVIDTSVPAYAPAFRQVVERGEAQPHEGHLFVLLDGELPRTGWQIPAAALGLLGVAGLNLWTLARALRRLFSGTRRA